MLEYRLLGWLGSRGAACARWQGRLAQPAGRRRGKAGWKRPPGAAGLRRPAAGFARAIARTQATNVRAAARHAAADVPRTVAAAMPRTVAAITATVNAREMRLLLSRWLARR